MRCQFPHSAESLAPVGRLNDLVAIEPERALQRLAHRRLVVNDEDPHIPQPAAES
jgi:hypothetical protein